VGRSSSASGLNDSYSRPPIEVKASAVSLGNKGRDDLALGQRVFHQKFGHGTIAAIEGNKLEIDFEHAGRKKVLDSPAIAALHEIAPRHAKEAAPSLVVGRAECKNARGNGGVARYP
jgi:hypothetical protein